MAPALIKLILYVLYALKIAGNMGPDEHNKLYKLGCARHSTYCRSLTAEHRFTSLSYTKEEYNRSVYSIVRIFVLLSESRLALLVYMVCANFSFKTMKKDR